MDPILQSELMINEIMQQAPMWVIQFFKGITFFGEETFFMILLPVFYWCIDLGIGYRFSLIFFLGNWINGFFKMLCHSPRPYWVSPKIKAYVTETSFGMPSGHSTNATTTFVFLATQYRKRKWLAIGFILMAILIMLSRLFLGVHFVRDVISGLLLGLLVLIAFWWVDQKISIKISAASVKQKIILSIVTSLVILGIGLIPLLGNTFELPAQWMENSRQATAGVAPDPYNMKSVFTLAGLWLGMNIGYTLLLESNHPKSLKGTTFQYLLRILIGLTITLVIRYGLSMAFSFAEGWLQYILDGVRYALMAFWIAYLAPILFRKMNLYKANV